MVTGLGLDVIEVKRVREKIEKGQGFKELVFSSSEIEYCEPKAHKYEHYAARFAAKEAFFKALGTGWANGTAFNEVIILNTEEGKPQISLTGKTAETLASINLEMIKVSLSHLKNVAAAVVIIES